MFLFKYDVIKSIRRENMAEQSGLISMETVRSYKKTSDAFSVFRGINQAQKNEYNRFSSTKSF